MAVSKRQFALLTEMGINLWQSRSLAPPLSDPGDQDVEPQGVKATQPLLDIDFTRLCQQPLFLDIILSLGSSLGEISCSGNAVNIGLLKWQFSARQAVQLNQTLLLTPDIEQLKHSPQLKSQLWLCIQKQGI